MLEKELSKVKAKELMKESSKLNPGRWVNHSENVAKISEKISEILELDKEKAYTYGLLHDIGRIKGNTGLRHTIDGYNYLISLGYKEVARYCITHSFQVKDITSSLGKNDFTKEEEEFIKNYLKNTEYKTYDRIVQLADAMGLPEGITIIERRLIDVHLRYGINEKTIENWKILYNFQKEIEEKIGHSMYKLFPETEKNIMEQLIKDILVF